MFQYEPLGPFEDRPAGYLDSGHFWIREFVTGGVFGFTMEPSGLLKMKGPDGEFAAEAPEPGMECVGTFGSSG